MEVVHVGTQLRNLRQLTVMQANIIDSRKGLSVYVPGTGVSQGLICAQLLSSSIAVRPSRHTHCSITTNTNLQVLSPPFRRKVIGIVAMREPSSRRTVTAGPPPHKSRARG